MFHKHDEIPKKDRLADFIKSEPKITNISIKAYTEYAIYMNKNLPRFHKFSTMHNSYPPPLPFVLMCISLPVCVRRCAFRCELLPYILAHPL